MSSPAVPAIPVRLHERPLIGGLVVPWVTTRTPDGLYRFGAIDADRAAQALHHRWCQICGQPLRERFVFAMRDNDIVRYTSDEPAMDPECARYAAIACPMLAGRMDHYRATPHSAQLAEIAVSHGDPDNVRAGHKADPWNLVFATEYLVIPHPISGRPAALLRPNRFRARPITRDR